MSFNTRQREAKSREDFRKSESSRLERLDLRDKELGLGDSFSKERRVKFDRETRVNTSPDFGIAEAEERQARFNSLRSNNTPYRPTELQKLADNTESGSNESRISPSFNNAGSTGSSLRKQSSPSEEVAVQDEMAAQQAASEEVELQEAEYANQLAQEQEAESGLAEVKEEINSIYEEGLSHSLYPFALNYIIFFLPLAIANDLAELLDLIPYIGFILSWFVSIFLSVLLILIFWFFNAKYKEAKNYLKNIDARLASIEHKLLILTRTTRYALGTAKALRKIPGIKGVARQIPRVLVKLRKPLKPLLRNPMIKLVVGAGLEAVPILSWVPWSTLSVILSYFDERKMYKDTKKVGLEIKQTYTEGLASEA